MFTDFEFADKRLSDFGWIVGHIDSNAGVSEVDIGSDITFNTVKNNHSSIHYKTSTSYDNVCISQPFDIFKSPCDKNQEDMYATNDEVSYLTKWLNRHEYRKFKPLYDSDDSDIHYYGSFNVKKKTINDRVVGLVLTFNSNAPYGFGEQITNEVDMDNNEMTASGEFIHVDDGAMGVKPENIKLFGKSTQSTVPGNQLFDASFYSLADIYTYGCILQENNGVFTITASENDMFVGEIRGAASDYEENLNGFLMTIPDSASYISVKMSNTEINKNFIVYYDENKKALGTEAATESEFTQKIWTGAKYFTIRFGKGDAVIGESYETTVMVNIGEPMDWEPYTGGEPSPNMKYLQKVEYLGASGSIAGKVLSGNLLGSYDEIAANGIVAKVDNGILHYYGTAIKDGTAIWIVGYYGNTEEIQKLNTGIYTLDNNCVIHSYDGTTRNIYKGTFTIEESVAITGILYNTTITSGTTYDEYVNIMFNLGDTPLSWKPYTEQPFTSLTPNGLPGIPLGQTIPDVIKNSPIHMAGVYWDSAEGRYYIADTKNDNGKNVQRIEKYTITGNEYWQAEQGSYGGQLSKHFATYTLFDCGIHGVNYTYGTSGWFHWLGDAGAWTTLTEWKNVIAGKNIYYILAEPIETDLTEDEMAQYNALCMNYPNTNIVNDAGAYMEVTYLQDYDNQFVICGDSDEYTTLYPNIAITCKRDGDLRIKNTLTGNVFEVLNCSANETIYINGEHKFIDSDNENHKNTTLFNDFNYNFLDINVTEDDFSENIYETSIPCKIVIDYSPIRKVGV